MICAMSDSQELPSFKSFQDFVEDFKSNLPEEFTMEVTRNSGDIEFFKIEVRITCNRDMYHESYSMLALMQKIFITQASNFKGAITLPFSNEVTSKIKAMSANGYSSEFNTLTLEFSCSFDVS